jgi:hypothetical protein
MNDRKRMDKDTRGLGRTERNEDSLVIRWSLLVTMSDINNYTYNQCIFFLKKMFRGTLSLTQENHLMSLNMTKHICCQDTLHKT